MKTVYKAQNLLVYRVGDEGEIQFRDTTRELGWKRSEFLMLKAQQLGLPAQEVLDKEARRQGWIAVKEMSQKGSAAPEEVMAEKDHAKNNTIILAKDVLDAVRHFKGEFTADGCRQTVGKSYTFCGDPDLGDFQCSPRGVKLAPKGEESVDFTWAKFIKFCKENGLIEEKPLKNASKPVSDHAKENPIHAAEDAPTCAPTVSDAQPSPQSSVGVDAKTEVSADDLPEVCRGCQCVTCGNKGCASPCWTKPNETSSCEHVGPAGVDCKDYKPKYDVLPENTEKPASAPAATAAAEEASVSLNGKCKTGKSPSGHCGAAACCNELYECCVQCSKDCNARCGWISAKEENVCAKPAPKAAAAATTNEPAAMNNSLEGAGVQTPPSSSDLDRISTLGLCSHVDCAAASLTTASALPAPTTAEFDYDGFDQPTVDTLHLAERMIRDARRDYIAKLAQAVYIVHDALCGGVVAICDNSKHGHRGEDTFRAWCASVGLSKDTAYRLLQVAALLNGSTPEEQAVLEAASPSLLYAAAKPSAPAQLVEGVKSGDITTHKQYQELLAQLRAKDQELAAERADREAERASASALLADEQHRRQESLRARLEAEKAAREAKNDRTQAQRKETLARNRAEEAEKAAKEAQKNEMLQIQRARDAENQRSMMEERERFYLARIAELEPRPVEVVGADPDEIERRAQVLADQKTAQIRDELERVRAEQNASDSQSDQRAVYDAVILAAQAMDAAWRSLIPVLTQLAPVEKRETVYQFVNQLMCMKEEALQMIEKEKKPDADHQN